MCVAKYIVQLRRGTTEEWATTGKDIVPLEGELVLEFCPDGLHRLKIGDGKNVYASLPYMSVDNFLLAQPVAKTVTLYLFASNWVEDGDRHSQVVSIADTTSNSKVDLQPSPEQLVIFHEKDIAFTTENNGGTITVYVVGQKPENDYEMQATITEVAVDD